MSDIIVYEDFESKLIEIDNQVVLIANDVAELYGIDVKHLNRAVNRHKELFPEHFRFQLSKDQKSEVVTLCHHLEGLKYSSTNPYAFTEQGLYMVATILQSDRAKLVHFHIIETFTKIRKISKNIRQVTQIDNPQEQHKLLKQSNELLHGVIDTDIVEEKVLDKKVKKVTDEIEINLGVLKFKRTIENKDKD